MSVKICCAHPAYALSDLCLHATTIYELQQSSGCERGIFVGDLGSAKKLTALLLQLLRAKKPQLSKIGGASQVVFARLYCLSLKGH